MGLLSPGGVHSHQDHMAALAKILAAAGIGCWSMPSWTAATPRPKARAAISTNSPALRLRASAIATLSGRYYAMDRDKRWDRVEKAYAALVEGAGASGERRCFAALDILCRGETDEFVMPTVLGDYAGMEDGDAMLFANFRADRAREILAALLDPDFDGFERRRRPALRPPLGMTEYSAELHALLAALFGPQDVRETWAR